MAEWEGAPVGVRTTIDASIVALTKNPATLDQNRIDIARAVRPDLVGCKAPSYDEHITARKGQHCPLQVIVAERCELLTTDLQTRSSSCQGCIVVSGGIVAYEIPSKGQLVQSLSFLYVASSMRACLWDSSYNKGFCGLVELRAFLRGPLLTLCFSM